LKIVTYNCKNIITNNNAILQLMESCDILLLQEHWLFHFQLDKLNTLHPDYAGMGKSVDSDDHLSPVQVPRGFGGVGIMWKKTLDPYITATCDGNHRIQVILVNVEPKPMMIMSVYMPCRGPAIAESEFRNMLDQVYEIVQKYSPSHNILLAGDWNADYEPTSTHAPVTARREAALSKMLHECELLLPHNYPTGATFIHPNGTDSSRIDFIFANESVSNSCSNFVKHDQLCTNTADHYPVSCSIRVKIVKNIAQKCASEDSKQMYNRINWTKVNISNYQSCVNRTIDTIASKEDSCDVMAGMIRSLVRDAAINSSPKVEQNIKKINRLWSTLIKAAVQVSKSANRKWKIAGKPREANNITVMNRKEARKLLRAAQRVEAAKRRDLQMEKLMNASQDDRQLFFTLVSRQRKSGVPQTQVLTVDGETYSSPSEICDGWEKHFSVLATPADNPKYDDEYRDQVDADHAWLEYVTHEEDTKYQR
jgi:endonuclease/exonuclease/phosphatase family metal-dependent hydrolase